MSVALLIARVALAAVFAAAAFGKLSDFGSARSAIEAFGLPRRPAHVFGTVLPFGELAIACALLCVGTAWLASVAAAVLLLAFCVAIIRLLARGETPECNCFGSLGSAPVGYRTLARNGMFLGVAGLIIVAGEDSAGAGAFAWAEPNPALATVGSVLGVAVVLQGAFSWQLFKQNGRLLVRISDIEKASLTPSDGRLEMGAPAPPFSLPDLDGDLVTLSDLLAYGQGALLFFTDPGCGHCAPVLPAVASAQANISALPVAVISTGQPEANRLRAAEHGIGQVLLQNGFEVAEQYGVFGMPGAVLLDADGRVAAKSVEGAAGVAELLARLLPTTAPTLNSPPDHTSFHQEVVA